MSISQIYMDNASTTQVDKRVVLAIEPFFEEVFANPSSVYSMGLRAKDAIDSSRFVIAKFIGAKTDEIIFTSGGSESNNLAIFGSLKKVKKGRIITSMIEHPSVLKPIEALEKRGFEVIKIKPKPNGVVSAQDIKKYLNSDTVLVTIMYANNEIGTIQPIAKIAKVIRNFRSTKLQTPNSKQIINSKLQTQKAKLHETAYPLFHTDACQAPQYLQMDVDKLGVDLLTINGSKIHAPKGIGALYVKNGTQIEPRQHGGNHEHKLRAGTENIPAIIGFSKAVELAKQKDILKMTQLRDKLIKEIQKIPDTYLNGPTGKKRLCNNINFSFKGVEGESLGKLLDDKGIATSTGSACSALTLEPSYILKAIGLSDELANSSLRISLSRFNTLKEIDYLIKILPNIIQKLRKISPIY